MLTLVKLVLQNRWAIFGLSILAWILSVVAVADCTFIRIGTRDTQYRNLDDIGLFNYNVDSEGHRCLNYVSSVEHDAATKTAQAFACLAAILTGFAMLQVVVVQLFLRWKTELVWKMIRVEVLAAAFSQAIVFAGFGTDVCIDDADAKCLPGPAGIINAINVLLLAVLSWLCWGMAPPTNPIFEVKLVTAEESDRDVENDQLSSEMADAFPTTAEADGREPVDAWGVTAQRASLAHHTESDEAVYAGSNYNSRGSSTTQDFEVPDQEPVSQEMQDPAFSYPPMMRESPGADPIEMNGRRGEPMSTGNYEAQDSPDSEERPHRHHHHKKRHHHQSHP